MYSRAQKLLWWLLCLFCFVITAAWQRDDEIKQDSTSNYNGTEIQLGPANVIMIRMNLQ